jgi:hypothetical protein
LGVIPNIDRISQDIVAYSVFSFQVMWQKVTSMSVIPFEQNLFFGYSGDNEPARYKGEINIGATFAKTPHKA